MRTEALSLMTSRASSITRAGWAAATTQPTPGSPPMVLALTACVSTGFHELAFRPGRGAGHISMTTACAQALIRLKLSATERTSCSTAGARSRPATSLPWEDRRDSGALDLHSPSRHPQLEALGTVWSRRSGMTPRGGGSQNLSASQSRRSCSGRPVLVSCVVCSNWVAKRLVDCNVRLAGRTRQPRLASVSHERAAEPKLDYHKNRRLRPPRARRHSSSSSSSNCGRAARRNQLAARHLGDCPGI